MPSLSTYVSDEIAPAVEAAAATENSGKIAPWIAEAIRQRLERCGRLPGSVSEQARKEADAIIAAFPDVASAEFRALREKLATRKSNQRKAA